jgi:alpha-L-fucosidase
VGRWGDYDDTTDRPANFPPQDGDWEGIPTTDESYGWNKFDTSHKPPSHFIQLLAKAAARGGNLLLNVGPMGNGEIDPKDVAILKGIGMWWQVYGDSIRGTTRTPLPVQTWGESTRKGNTLYLHVFTWPKDGNLIVGGLKSEVKSASLMGDSESGDMPVKRLDADDVSISVPLNAPDKVDSVVVLDCTGDIQTDNRRLLQPVFPLEMLRAFDGNLKGGLRYGPGKKTDDYVINWNSEDQSVTWPVRLEKAATYEVLANYTAPADSAGGTFTVNFGSQSVSGQVKAGVDQTVSLGVYRWRRAVWISRLRAQRLVGMNCSACATFN